MRPDELIDASEAAHRRLLADVDRLTDEQVAEPSRLPDWSRGHVLTHLARNADSHVGMFEGAAAGEVRPQYPSVEHRRADIEAGAGRSAAALRDDLHASCARLEAAWHALPDDRWGREGITVAGPRSMTELVFRRLREIEVHHVDLGVGYSPADWSPAYVDGELRRRLPGLPDRADHGALVWWLMGRGDAPNLGPW
jgi:maleylpyruvate isomerase